MFLLASHKTLNLINKDAQRIKKSDKWIVAGLNYEDIEFPVYLSK